MLLPKTKEEIRKPTKTLAGVTPIAVMCKPQKCKHGTCLYCPSLDVPQSYTPKSPPVLRAELLNYDPFEQIKSRIKAYSLMNHPTNKIELIIMGGNFLDYPQRYKTNFVKRCFDAMNNKVSRNLEQAKKVNESSKNRCVALCIESRPDTILEKGGKIKELLKYGCTRVELGVQCLDDAIYKKIKRHHSVLDVAKATKLLKQAGFKVGYHMMIGLPGSSEKKDLLMFKKIFSDDRFKPDQLKIYPCQVIRGAKLVELYKNRKYRPYSEEKIKRIIIKIMRIIPNYCRVMRIMREIPPEFLIAGTTRIDLRKDIEYEIKKRRLKIREIRFREIGFLLRDSYKKIDKNLKLKTTIYPANRGEEYFLEFVNKKNTLFALCRLRLQDKEPRAIIREIHVYGQSLDVGEKKKGAIQHRGLGKALIKEAERITKQNKIEKLFVISGVGAREYYYKLGYKLEKEYVTKKIKK